MERSKTKVEQKAITKVRDLIDKIDFFTYYFKEMDKNISWDGTIEMYNGNTDIKENYDYLVVSTPRFNFPLSNDYTITSFYNHQREIYGQLSLHTGWDFATDEKTPIYSVCNGVVEEVLFTQEENIT